MNYSEYIFIGEKNEPFFMVEINKINHNVVIFKPDKYSKKLKDLFEKYYLGELLYEINYEKIIFMKHDTKHFNQIKDFEATILSELLIKIKHNQYVLINDDIRVNYK